jgi:hypothetical protein
LDLTLLFRIPFVAGAHGLSLVSLQQNTGTHPPQRDTTVAWLPAEGNHVARMGFCSDSLPPPALASPHPLPLPPPPQQSA